MTTFLTTIFILVAILIVLVVLVQRGRGGGLAGAFGSGGGSTSAFGTKTGDVFTTVTVVLFVIFMLMAIWLNFRFRAYTSPIAGSRQVEPTLTTMPGDVGAMPPSTAPAPAGFTPGGAMPDMTPATPAPASAPAGSQPK